MSQFYIHIKDVFDGHVVEMEHTTLTNMDSYIYLHSIFVETTTTERICSTKLVPLFRQR
uniref:Uncharacterized protein n=1 Tax=Arion vulgaris TaxID=1028688 RepID=A0A0B6XYJ6_9EUPU